MGTLGPTEERVLQWFAINLLKKDLKSFSVAKSAVILDVGPRDLELTFAVTSRTDLTKGRRSKVKFSRLSAFGHQIKLATVTFPGLGLLEARRFVLTQNRGSSDLGDLDEEGRYTLHSECMNPISEAQWAYKVRNWRGGSMSQNLLLSCFRAVLCISASLISVEKCFLVNLCDVFFSLTS